MHRFKSKETIHPNSKIGMISIKQFPKIAVIMLVCLSSRFDLRAQNNVSNYKTYYAAGEYSNKKYLIIRKYEQTGQLFYVGIDPEDLETKIIPSKDVAIQSTNWPQILIQYKNSAYVRALQAATKHSGSIQNAGIVHGYPKEKGVTLTIDLCPSHKPLDRVIFTSLITEFQKIEKPVPIALSITGRFMLTHSEDFDWLKTLITSGDIRITWVNHTYNHHYNPQLPLKNNFLLEPNTDLNYEILGTEMALLQKGMLFSVFFRFPGLVSNHQLVNTVLSYGLIPIGSDAWLAKGQPVYTGSIVLIHGNGNEPLGIKDFIQLLQKENTAIKKKQWLLYDLRESVEDEFKE